MGNVEIHLLTGLVADLEEDGTIGCLPHFVARHDGQLVRRQRHRLG